MPDYRRNHYVPEWYQKRFLPKGQRFYYLDLKPETVVSNGHKYHRRALLRWGAEKCFCEQDLYTTRFGKWESTEIEQKFFGKIDDSGRDAVEYFSTYNHDSISYEALYAMLPYMTVQKLRTPKGLKNLAQAARLDNKNLILFKLQEIQQIFCALWSECIWTIADASDCRTKFLVSDHPVTVYNKACFPLSAWCRDCNDPGIWLSASHTLFPLNQDKILILTNLSWVRNPYSNPLDRRPNPKLFRPAVFNFLNIQVGRKLSELEVVEINYVLKQRAWRYIAAAEKEWLYPERHLKTQNWDKLGSGYLFMPDPRSVSFSSEILIGYTNQHVQGFDAYGRRPWHPEYNGKDEQNREWATFQAFKGEFARLFGPKHRGSSNDFGNFHLGPREDSPQLHESHLQAERRYSKNRYKKRR
ncbi:DUF4238 domain-containing protein [Geomonas subterranea]|uniref:DUF4238 domain-containing protein n=1 Tax=Geomonas subterranea TaxID=2847989 RepID=A0ABX8LI53_9BACT|nr:DUF4238 domain-containing protein [Geomonas subterranea]QXE91001.1 DUF4238 domain-containing protein [Geomonas subterranea]QXM10913.1 DUF4238 domain-containing protein [Geomonas subterranea]